MNNTMIFTNYLSLLGTMMILQTFPFNIFDLGFFGIFTLFIIFFVIIWFVVIIFVMYRVCKSVRAQRRTVAFPSQPSLRRERHVLRETLPVECPECDAPLKYNEVKWVGPRRAECPYCGNVVDLIETEVVESY